MSMMPQQVADTVHGTWRQLWRNRQFWAAVAAVLAIVLYQLTGVQVSPTTLDTLLLALLGLVGAGAIAQGGHATATAPTGSADTAQAIWAARQQAVQRAHRRVMGAFGLALLAPLAAAVGVSLRPSVAWAWAVVWVGLLLAAAVEERLAARQDH